MRRAARFRRLRARAITRRVPARVFHQRARIRILLRTCPNQFQRKTERAVLLIDRAVSLRSRGMLITTVSNLTTRFTCARYVN